MRLITAIGTAVLSLTLAAPAYAQEQHEQEDRKEKPAQQENKEEKKPQAGKPAQHEQKPQPEKNARQEKAPKQEEKAAQPERNNKPEEKQAQQQQRQDVKPGNRDQRGRIPDDRYRANFGREHSFRVSRADYSNHRFQYGGYWFGFVDPWPSNWLYTQDVYVIEIDGVYYLCNASYPGVNLAINVTL